MACAGYVQLTLIVFVGYNVVNAYRSGWESDNSMDIMRGVKREYALGWQRNEKDKS